ncbi:MAG: serine/threonine protein kinase [Burkholderiales bacterium]
MSSHSHPFDALTPDVILDAVDSVGLRSDGRLLALNSYENRVWQVGIEDDLPIVAKFYRPRRWTDAQILEEHAFARELADAEVPVVAPLAFGERTLFEHAGFRIALWPRRGGRAPELDRGDVLEWIGRFIARLHAVGSRDRFEAREKLRVQRMAQEPRDFLLGNGFIPASLVESYRSVADLAIESIEAVFERVGPCRQLRLHGDCHAGNVLWTDAGPHFVDLDDAITGPAVQDLWMLLSGDRETQESQLRAVLAGYEVFREFDRVELLLIEALRTMRMMHYAGWLARRWDDPAFPATFQWFNTQRYWEDHVLALREQVGAMDEPGLAPD